MSKIYYENLENGEIYTSIRDAAKKLKMPFPTFAKKLRTKRMPQIILLSEEQVISRAEYFSRRLRAA